MVSSSSSAEPDHHLGLTRRSNKRQQTGAAPHSPHHSPPAPDHCPDYPTRHRAPAVSSRRQGSASHHPYMHHPQQNRRRSFRSRCICVAASLSVLGGVPAAVRFVLLRRHAPRHNYYQHNHKYQDQHQHNDQRNEYQDNRNDGQQQQQQQQHQHQHGRTNQPGHNLRDAIRIVRDPHRSARIRSLCLLSDGNMHGSYDYGPCPAVTRSGDDDHVVNEGEYHNDDDDGSNNDDDADIENDDDDANDDNTYNEDDDDGVEEATAHHHHKCKPRQNWYQHPHPNCNTFYEQWGSVENLRKINEGYTTAVYEMLHHAYAEVDSILPDADWHRATGAGEHAQRSDRYVFKVNLFRDAFEHDAKREEATLLEQLSRSPYIPYIYGFCGTSTLNPFAASGTLYDLIKSIRYGGDDYLDGHVDALRIGVQVAEGLAALHDADFTGHPTFSQNDLDISQYTYDDKMQTFQLGDLNNGHFILYDENDEPCKATSGMGPWKYRSPEDLAALTRNGPPFHLFTSDVFSLGGVLFMILTKQWLWEEHGESREAGTDRIIRGELPPVPEEFSGSDQDEAASEALLRAIYDLCWVYDPDKRASAQEVATYLKEKLESIRPGEISRDGGGRSSGIVRVSLPPILSNVLDLDDDYDAKM